MHLHESVTDTRTINTFNRYKLKLLANTQYDYSKVVYKYSTEQVIIICKLHGEFKQTLSEHFKGRGCPTCGINKMKKSKTTDFATFKAIALNTHNNKYSYSESSYSNLNNKLTITCPEHGNFEQNAYYHMKGSECPKCVNTNTGDLLRMTTKDFISKALSKHGERYDYSLVNYLGTKHPVTIICSIHGQFQQTPHIHLLGSGCTKCRNEHLADTKERFIQKAILIHGDLYKYSNVNYVNNLTKIKITCQICGDFEQTPGNHLSGKGCPNCATYGFNSAKPAILYYLSINNGQAYKIGITNRTIEERFRKDIHLITIIKTWFYEVGQKAYEEEQRILKEFKTFKYVGEALLESGNTELFNTDILRAFNPVGYDQAHMVTLPNNSDLSTIIDKRATLQGTND